MDRESRPGADASSIRRELRPLGPRGEGWIGIQTAIALIVLVGAAIDPLAWAGDVRAATSAVGIVLCLLAVALFAWGTVTLGATFSIWVTPRSDGRLATWGPYRWMRHPICTAQAVFGLGWSLMWGSPLALVLCAIYAVYLDRGKLRREEETLRGHYPGYAQYAATVTHRMWPAPPRREQPTAAVGPRP